MFYNEIMIAKNYRLQDFSIELKDNQILILASGWKGYYNTLKLIYGDACKSIFDAKSPYYQWGVYIDKQENNYTVIETLMSMMMNVVAINDNLRQSFSLGYHFHSDYEGDGRTEVGSKVYKAKPYSKPLRQENLENAKVLAVWFASFMERHPLYLHSDYIIGVPCKSDKVFDLPTYISEQVAKTLNIQIGNSYVFKAETSSSQKDIPLEKRNENVKNSFNLSDNVPFNGKVVTIIDDIYDTGSTINELGHILHQAGATVQGLTATRINRRS